MPKKKIIDHCHYSKCNKPIYEGQKAIKFAIDPDIPAIWFCNKEHCNIWYFYELMPKLEKKG